MKSERLFKRLMAGSVGNVRFQDLRRLLTRLGWHHVRSSGSHHVFTHDRVPYPVSIQERRGDAKPYQLRQLVQTIREYDLRLDGHDD